MDIPKIPESFQEAGKVEMIPDMVAAAISRNLPLALHFDALIEQDLREGRKGHTTFTDEKKVKYLMFLSKTGQKMRGAAYAGVSQEQVRQTRKNDPKFAEAEQEAVEMFQEILENEALRRAIDGWDEPVYQKGELVGHIHRKSERMMELLLKANLPHKFRENVKMDLTATGGVLVAPASLSAEEWEEQYGQGKAKGPTIDGEATETPLVSSGQRSP